MAQKALTAAERRLLEWPPTPETWKCKKRLISLVPGEERVCPWVMAGYSQKCTGCGTPMPSKPERLFPAYLLACEKAGIEPGTRWPIRQPPPTGTTPTKRKGGK